MIRPKYITAAVVALLSFLVGCSGSNGSPSAAEKSAGTRVVTEEEARQVLQNVSAQAPASSAHEFCGKLSLQRQACEDAWEESVRGRCLEPQGAPRVVRSAVLPHTKNTDGGRVLLVEGKTAGGQKYVSEFLVTAPSGKPVASLGVYWSGWGLGDSPLGEDSKLLPKSECR